MHNNETFLKKLAQYDIEMLLLEAEELGPQYVAALKDQLNRLNIKL